MVTTYEVSADGLTRKPKKKRVKAAQIEVPWAFPAITQDSLDERIRRAEAAQRSGWASPQSLSASLGFDPAEETERMAAAGLQFGGVVTPPATAPRGGDPNA